jgi:HNH endonuclease/Protein of unknown function (DUF1376)
MSKRPYIAIHTDNYLADTVCFSAVEHGAYLLLLIEYLKNDTLPSGDAELARITRMPIKKWACVKDGILPLFSKRAWWDNRTAVERGCALRTETGIEGRPAIPKEIRCAVVAKDGSVCIYCGDESGPFDLDHRLPWSRGGQHSFDNLVVACRTCNRSKGSRTVEEWLG